MILLALLELFITSLLAATVNVQPVISTNERWLRVVYQSDGPMTLKVSKGEKNIEFRLEAQKELKEVKLSLPSLLSDEITIEVLQKNHQLTFPHFSLSPPLRLQPTKQQNLLGSLVGQVWTIPKGIYQVKGHHEITHSQIQIIAGSEFYFHPQSSLVLKGQSSLMGTKYAPIRFQGSSPQSDYFIQLLQSENQLSQIQHVTISGNALALNQLPTGTLSLHGGNFMISHLLMQDLQSEDALNIINSSATIDHSQFKNLSSDAIDCDFCSLEASSLEFDKIQGDGIDLSGATLNAQDITMSHIQDKGFSIGENSRAELKRIQVHHSQIGAAIKDASLAKIKGYDFKGCKTPITLYTKKMWFSTPPELQLSPPFPDKKDFIILNQAKLIEEAL